MNIWRVNGLVPRLLLVLTSLVIVVQLSLLTLNSWENNETDNGIVLDVVTYDNNNLRQVQDLERGLQQSLSDKVCDCGLEKSVKPDIARVHAVVRETKGFLTIGIPTIQRQNGSYLTNTLDSLINSTTEEERKEVVLVIFLADFDQTVKDVMARELQEKYQTYIDQGFIQVIQAPKSFYPTLENLKRTYNHPENQVKWRSKQNYDYAYLFKYSVNVSTYYMQVEDDIVTMHKFVTAIKHYIDAQTSAWVCLEFSTLGYIGKLYHSHDLDKLAKMLMLFYEEQPPDFLYLYFNVFLTQFQQRLRIPTLFQHMGYHSSLANKVQPLKDQYFDNTVKLYHGDNPSAGIYTSFQTFEPFNQNLAYSLADGFFWAKDPKKGDALLLVFDRPEKLSKIIIDTGSESHRDDIIMNGVLEAAVTLVSRTLENAQCTNFITLGNFSKGSIQVDNLPKLVPFDIFCFRVTMTEEQSMWIIFREIAVFR